MGNKLIENIDAEVWNKFAGLSKIKDKKVGEYLTEVLKEHLKKEGVK
jgi:hypothetical protein|tara:strand:+ start:4667 stop:4807 length:141 start_codon:yes stop_codon:yes gene_type:complete